MSELEFQEVVNFFGISNPWNGLEIQYHKNEYVVIKGNVPLEVVNNIENYFCKQFDNKIVIKEELILFFVELQKYFEHKNDKEYLDINTCICSCVSSMLQKVCPSISMNEWLEDVIPDLKKYSTNFVHNHNLDSLKMVLKEFDLMVNPFMDKNVPISFPLNLVDKFYVSAKCKKSHRNSDVEMSVTNLHTGNKIEYVRNYYTISYRMIYQIKEGNYFEVCHFVSNEDIQEMDRGEKVTICYYSKNKRISDYVQYNISNGTVSVVYGQRELITLEQQEYIYKQLLKAVECARTIFYDFISLESSTKSYIKR